MTDRYDAVIVGARCAGAPTAMLLAQRGRRILLVDRATFPSDTLSTLIIHAPGVAALRRWGLLDAVLATGCPTIEQYTFDFGPIVISGSPHAADGASFAIAPRRTLLDTILLDAAGAAGAEVIQGFTFEDVISQHGAVVGIRGRGPDGETIEHRSTVVIGADGWNSRVARAVGAEQYHDKPVLENAFYTYWSGLPFTAFTTWLRGDRGIAAIPTNDGRTLLLVGCPFDQASEFRKDVETNYLAALEREPELAKRVRGAQREEGFLGGGVPNFFRTPFGPGWALVGDAGYTKDPITGQGISDAFRSAQRCTDALATVFDGARSFDEVMTEYQQERDQGALPLYEFTAQLATLEPPPPEMQGLLGAIIDDQEAKDAFVSVTAGTLSPADFFQPADLN